MARGFPSSISLVINQQPELGNMCPESPDPAHSTVCVIYAQVGPTFMKFENYGQHEPTGSAYLAAGESPPPGGSKP